MKKHKTLKSISLVALSAVMVAGVAMAAAGCGGGGGSGGEGGGTQQGGNGDPEGGTLTVSMFCSEADKATNQKIADDWAVKFNAANHTNFTPVIANNPEKDKYFERLYYNFINNAIGDVMYVAPRYVRAWAKAGRLIDLTQFINEDAEAQANVNKVWDNALSYYGYNKSKADYSMGQNISYNADGADGAGFYTAAGEKTGLYALPKDYSNFSMGYNRNFFTEDMKTKYTTTKASAARNVKGPTGGTDSPTDTLIYTGGDSSIITYAAGPNAGQEANIINIGIPTTYKPFDFYKYKTFNEALNGGDPMAMLVAYYTQNKGYTVTIPGFPDETFTVTDESKKDKNEDAIYDTSEGHMVYTYAEYGALQWALAYYLNTFAWDHGQDGLNGTGGKWNTGEGENAKFDTVFGGEQYEGKSGASVGSVLYLLPWLYSNDADLINNALTACVSYRTDGEGTTLDKINALLNTSNIDITSRETWRNYVGNATNKVTKMNLDGSTREADVQFGFNSERFLETYGAFLAIGSDWNGNPCDSDTAQSQSGWDFFRAGRSIFYGAGTWDAATRNESDQLLFDFGQMPTPVAEKYALYSSIKGANYEMVTYSNYSDPDGDGTPGAIGAQAAELSAGLKVYDEAAINANLLIRQDKWGARMDSVGYAVTNKALGPNGEVTNRTRAAASLCAALTISAQPQIDLTYAGAQLPNFKDQCKALLNYQTDEYKTEGAFANMITPDGSATVTGEAGKALYDYYYGIAKEMGQASRNGSTQTVADFLASKSYNGEPIKYDTSFATTQLKDFKGETTNYGFAMKVLYLVAYRHKDLDLNIRMQYGLNSVRDSTMYTYNDDWVAYVDARTEPDANLAYNRQRSIDAAQRGSFLSDTVVRFNPKSGTTGKVYLTPVVYALSKAKAAYDSLQEARRKETQESSNTPAN